MNFSNVGLSHFREKAEGFAAAWQSRLIRKNICTVGYNIGLTRYVDYLTECCRKSAHVAGRAGQYVEGGGGARQGARAEDEGRAQGETGA